MPDEDSNQSGTQVALSANQRTTDENSNQMTIRPHALISLHQFASVCAHQRHFQGKSLRSQPPALTNLRRQSLRAYPRL